ncbi:hypothetical protein [Bernardetia sp.]|uniref:hypothetical protein n=1 Tax=Bernardetia sp. TaxID=1937974 RepID=UPI0025BA23C4|nr:hypothetical protein [Bernardetia sp.]
MANLLSPNDLGQIDKAFQKDLPDTFLKNDIIYHLAGQIYDPFMESNTDTNFTDIPLKGLIVDSDSKQDAQVRFTQMGRTDMSEHYVSINFAQLESNGLVDGNRELLMQPNADCISVRGNRYEVTAVTQVADLNDLKTYVRISYRDNIRPKK